MSSMFKKVKTYYVLKIWSKAKVHDAVGQGWITAQEYYLITGEVYR